MKEKQGSYILGSVKIRISGKNVEAFLNHCANQGIVIWDIIRIDKDHCEAKVYLKDISTIRRLRQGTPYKIKFISKYGLPFIRKRILSNKPLISGLIISLLVLLLISNMIWKITITGVPIELENKITEQLDKYGVHPGALKPTIDSPNQIQQLLIHDIPELLWIGVEEKGTTYHLEAVEKIIVNDAIIKPPQNIIASKDAVVTSMFVKKGQPKVKIHDHVKKGDILVSGQIEKINTRVEDEDASTYEIIAAEGEVWATTWYTASVSVPLAGQTEELTGASNKSYVIKLGDVALPIWPWKKNNFANQKIETKENQLKILNYKVPLSLIQKNNMESNVIEFERTREEAIQIGIEQTKKDLLRILGEDTEILSEKVLHETIEHGKVKLSLYITVLENIALEQPLSQGD